MSFLCIHPVYMRWFLHFNENLFLTTTTTTTKKACCWTPSLLILHEIFRIAQLMYSLISYIILLSSDCVVLDPYRQDFQDCKLEQVDIFFYLLPIKNNIFFYLLYSNFLFGVGEDKICWRVSCMSKFDVRLWSFERKLGA